MLNILENNYEKGLFPILDLKAAYYLADKNDVDESVLLLLALLFTASRKGHLCVHIDKDMSPPLNSIWKIEGDEEAYKVLSLLQKGFKNLQKNWQKYPCIKIIDQKLYLQKNYLLEKEVEKHFYALENKKPALEISLLQNDFLNELQNKALKVCFSHCLSFISGGPGVGKTFTASVLIQEFLKNYPKANIAICAPTGKAVANLEQSLTKTISLQENIKTYTLHKLFHKKIISFLPFDLIIVDESSMIDASFMLLLLKFNKPGSRLVFLGDPHQLPPIGSGFIFSDLKNKSQNKAELSVCLRTEIQDILESAKYVKEGNTAAFLSLIEKKKLLFDLSQKNVLFSKLLEKLPKADLKKSLYQNLKNFQSYKILSPLRKGEFGVESLNQKIQKAFNSPFVPIIILSNDYSLELYNGDMGMVGENGEAIFFSRNQKEPYYNSGENIRQIPTSLLPSYELAYCISIHKSQGSEYEKVSIIIPEVSEVFSRELLYTAITRAKKYYEIFSSKNTLQELISNQSRRVSGIETQTVYE